MQQRRAIQASHQTQLQRFAAPDELHIQDSNTVGQDPLGRSCGEAATDCRPRDEHIHEPPASIPDFISTAERPKAKHDVCSTNSNLE